MKHNIVQRTVYRKLRKYECLLFIYEVISFFVRNAKDTFYGFSYFPAVQSIAYIVRTHRVYFRINLIFCVECNILTNTLLI